MSKYRTIPNPIPSQPIPHPEPQRDQGETLGEYMDCCTEWRKAGVAFIDTSVDVTPPDPVTTATYVSKKGKKSR